MTAPSSPTRRPPMVVLLGIGTLTNFFDALGIGSFATTTAALRLGRLVDDENIPGTMNVGHATPTILTLARLINVGFRSMTRFTPDVTCMFKGCLA